MSATRPFYPAAERNRQPIAERLQDLLTRGARVLEIGAGTGQHAAYVLSRRPDLYWQATDISTQLDGIRMWLNEVRDAIVPAPVELDVLTDEWPAGPWDAIFAANVCHIVPWGGVCAIFAAAGQTLAEDGSLILYGPFDRDGKHTSEGNKRMNESLRAGNPDQGLRDERDLDSLADMNRLRSADCYDMPANNRLLVWRRIEQTAARG